MRRLLALLAFLPITASAQAPVAPEPFLPITVQEGDYNALKTWLLEQPAKFANPVLAWLEQRERDARMAKLKEKMPAPGAEKQPGDK